MRADVSFIWNEQKVGQFMYKKMGEWKKKSTWFLRNCWEQQFGMLLQVSRGLWPALLHDILSGGQKNWLEKWLLYMFILNFVYLGADILKHDGIYSRYFTSFKGNGRYNLKVHVQGQEKTVRRVRRQSQAMYVPGYVEDDGKEGCVHKSLLYWPVAEEWRLIRLKDSHGWVAILLYILKCFHYLPSQSNCLYFATVKKMKVTNHAFLAVLCNTLRS